MKGAWRHSNEAQTHGALGELIFSAGLLAREPTLGRRALGTVSVKVEQENAFGDTEEVLWIALGSASARPGVHTPDDFMRLRLVGLRRVLEMGEAPHATIAAAMNACIVEGDGSVLPQDVLLHAALPHRFIDHSYPDAVLAISNTPDGVGRLKDAYQDLAKIVVVEDLSTGPVPYARATAPGLDLGGSLGLVLAHRGLLAFGQTARECYENTVQLVAVAVDYLARHGVMGTEGGVTRGSVHPFPKEIAEIRAGVSSQAGFPLILTSSSNALSLDFARRDDVTELLSRGPVSPDHRRVVGRSPRLVTATNPSREEGAPADRGGPGGRTIPSAFISPEFGMACAGRTAEAAQRVADALSQEIRVILLSSALSTYSPESVSEVPTPLIDQSPFGSEGPDRVFTGEVALVTGSSSGIGRSCVEALLERGAAVAGVDINPAVTSLFEREDYIGIACDVTDEAAVKGAIATTVCTYGGLDMLVLNAGIFPKGCKIEELSLQEWHRVIRTNLDANVTVLREAVPYLRLSPRHGRVVVMGSRNYRAPGPGVAPYSASKAGLVQLARVAALELAEYGIRVNIVHPDQVFDTGLWTEEVLQTRARNYGMSVEEYRRNNLLGVEITSRDVAEMVAEMCGPLFSKTTGAQVPIDGGNLRIV